jgi:hypothetical protein
MIEHNKLFSRIRLIACLSFLILGIGAIFHRSISHSYGVSFPRSPDWDLHLSWAETTRQSVIGFGQLPLWNRQRCGGAPLFGEPESDILSLYFPLLMLFGPTFGYIGALIAYIGIGSYGFYRLGRSYGVSKEGSYLMALSYMGSGIIVIPFANGAPNFLAASYLPYICILLKEYLKTRKASRAFGVGVFMALMFFAGFHYIFAVILLVVVWVVAFGFLHKTYSVFLSGIVPLLWFVGLSAIKLFPTIESLFTREFIFRGYVSSGYSLQRLFYSLLWPIQTTDEFNRWGRDIAGFVFGASYGLMENGMYIGVILCVFGLIGCIRQARQYRVLVVILLLFLWLGFGYNIAPSIFRMLHSLPLLSYMEVAQRYRYIFMIPFVIFIGMGFDLWSSFLYKKYKKRRREVKIFLIAVIVLVTAELLFVNTRIFYDGFHLTPLVVERNKPFIQHCIDDATTKLDQEFPIVAQGLGMSNCVENVLIKRYAACKEDSNYKGEAYMTETGDRVVTYRSSPHRVEATLESQKGGAFVINQNYDTGWWVVINGVLHRPQKYNGLLAVNIEPGMTSVMFFYLPISFVLGVVVSLALFGWGLRLHYRRVRRNN